MYIGMSCCLVPDSNWLCRCYTSSCPWQFHRTNVLSQQSLSGLMVACRWGLQALYISWLIPAPAPQAPATATFLSGLGFCGLDPGLLQALKGRSGGWDATASSGGVGCSHDAAAHSLCGTWCAGCKLHPTALLGTS